MKHPLIFWIPLLALALAGCSGTSTDGTGESRDRAVERDPGLWPRHPSPLADSDAHEAQIDALLERMSVEEKVGQMMQPELRNVTPEDVRNYHLGSILNGGGSYPHGNKSASAAEWLELADAFYLASIDDADGRTAIPLFWGTDAVHGHNNVWGATLFPHNIGLGAARNPELIRRIAEVTAVEVSVTGQDWNFAPTLAVARDARWGRTYEAYAETPEILYDYGKAITQGLQGRVDSEDFFGPGRMIATAKHWIADGGTEGGIDRGDANISERALRDIHAAGYFGALDAGVQSVMVSFSSWQGEKLHGHRYLMTDVLKDQMAFDGFIVGDWNGHEFVDGCRGDSCPQAINAGLDIFMVPDQWRELYKNTVEQVKSGEISEARIDDAVRRILRVKFRAGLFDTVRPSERVHAGRDDLLGAPEHREVARQAVRESLVLLKNNDALLPLDPGARILVAGDGADHIGKQSGGWSLTWQGTGTTNEDFPGATSLYAGLAEQIEAAGGDIELSESGEYQNRPDVAIVVFGEDPYAEMHGDRRHLNYDSEGDLELLQRLQDQGIPVVSVFLTGRPLWVNPELNASDAFVVAWLPGTEGQGIADVILQDGRGDTQHDFVGRLSFSWPATADQSPLNDGDADYAPLFPYGFGLTYSDQSSLPELAEDPQLSLDHHADGLTLFEGRPMEPWQLQIGDSSQRALVVTGSEANLPGIELRSVDRDFQEDARRVAWTGAGSARLSLSSQERTDLSGLADQEGALVFNVRVDQAPAGTVTLGMNCGEGCGSSLDVTNALAALEPGQWQALSISLRCFAEGDNDLTGITDPFVLETDAPASLSLHYLRLERSADTDLSCDA